MTLSLPFHLLTSGPTYTAKPHFTQAYLALRIPTVMYLTKPCIDCFQWV